MSLLDLINQASRKPTYSSNHYEPMPKKKDITGKKYGTLTVIKGEYTQNSDLVVCKCDCGEILKKKVQYLLDDQTACPSKAHKFGHFKERSELSTKIRKEIGDIVQPKLAKGAELSIMYRKFGIPRK